MLPVPERARLRELERENRELKMRVDFLSEAAAYLRRSIGNLEVRTASTDTGACTLLRGGERCPPELVRRLMRELGLAPCQPRPWRHSLTEQDGRVRLLMNRT